MTVKIIVIGNIGCGKTTLAKKLSQSLKLPFYPIDDLRRLYGNGTIKGEYLALAEFLGHAESKESCILEFTGAGIHKHSLRLALQKSNAKIIVIAVLCEKNVALRRLEMRRWDIPTPFQFNLNQHWSYVQKELEEDLGQNSWKIRPTSLIIKITSDMRLKQNYDTIVSEITQFLEQ